MISKLQNRSIINYFDRNKFLIKIVQLIMTTIISVNCICINAYAVQNVNTNEKIDITSPSAILVEASTGTVIYEKNSDEVRSPASITKIMTLLLIFDAIERGKIGVNDEVCTSAYAKSMGGSQVFLEEGEIQTVDTLIKCIVVASGNDASVAMAEYVAGSEAEFVNMMNEKAKAIGMTNTHFIDCCGLTSDNQHFTTARDVSIMSRELITKYPKIFDYTKIWMEDITHTTKQGTKKFTLSSTNKLLKQYQWTTGLKTGSTSVAKYCLSATAKKDNIELIAVIMGAPEPKIRFLEARKMLDYGFATAKIYEDTDTNSFKPIKVAKGKKDYVDVFVKDNYKYLDVSGMDFSKIEKKVSFSENIQAPIEIETKVGKITYLYEGKEIGYVDILAKDMVEKANFVDYIKKIGVQFLII